MTVSHLKNEIERLISEYNLEDKVVRVIVETDKKNVWRRLRLGWFRRGAMKKRRFRKELHERTYEINWNHNLPVYGEKKKWEI